MPGFLDTAIPLKRKTTLCSRLVTIKGSLAWIVSEFDLLKVSGTSKPHIAWDNGSLVRVSYIRKLAVKPHPSRLTAICRTATESCDTVTSTSQDIKSRINMNCCGWNVIETSPSLADTLNCPLVFRQCSIMG